MSALTVFHQFFDSCIGGWDSERTYHYLSEGEIERSHTEFQVQPLTAERKVKVLTDNAFEVSVGGAFPQENRMEICPGFHLMFHTVSEAGVTKDQSLNLAFVPNDETVNNEFVLEGAYLRDRAYEEDRPIISDFRFDARTRELLMTTRYTRVISVDSITLVNPQMRIRRIFNYLRPPEGQPLDKLALVGFGVEQKRVV
ncbi:MAG: phycobiliprotein lyase [Cyanobacteria bacterium J06560_6]